jgi:hypothetical protein
MGVPPIEVVNENDLPFGRERGDEGLLLRLTATEGTEKGDRGDLRVL